MDFGSERTFCEGLVRNVLDVRRGPGNSDSLREEISFDSGRSFRVLRWEHTLAHVEMIQEPNRLVPLAWHGNHWHYHRASELTLILKGTGTRFVADHIEHFESGDLVLLGCNLPHYWHLRGESKGLAIQWHFPMEHGIWHFAETVPLKRLEEAARRGLHIRGKTAQVTRLRLEQMVETSGIARLSAFLDLLGCVAAAPLSDVRTLARRPFSLSGTAEHEEAISRAVSYILANYREEIPLSDLLKLVSMSRPTFARQFQRHAGKSFSVFLNQVRLQSVCQALRETSEPISTIALAHGFNNLSFFNRLFHREFGMNPTLYRRNLSQPAMVRE